MSGRSTTTWRSNRPGRTSAASSVSGRLVAAIRMMPRLASNPSICDQQLVQRLVALVVVARPAGAPGLAQGVELVDEDQARGLGLGLRRTGSGPAPRRRRRTSRRSRTPRARRTARPPRPRPPWPAASCPCPAARRAGPPWESARRSPGTSRASGGTRPPRELGDRLVVAGDVVEGDPAPRPSRRPRCRLRANAMAEPSPPPRCRRIQTGARSRRASPAGCRSVSDERRPGLGLVGAVGDVLIEQPGSSSSCSIPTREVRNRTGRPSAPAGFNSPVSSVGPTRTDWISPAHQRLLELAVAQLAGPVPASRGRGKPRAGDGQETASRAASGRRRRREDEAVRRREVSWCPYRDDPEGRAAVAGGRADPGRRRPGGLR